MNSDARRSVVSSHLNVVAKPRLIKLMFSSARDYSEWDMWGLTSTPPRVKFVVFNPPSGLVPLPVKPDPVRLKRQPASPTCRVKSTHGPGVCYRMDTLLYILLWDDVRWRSSRLSSTRAVPSISKTGMATPPSMWPVKMATCRLWWPSVKPTAIWISPTR